MRSGTHARDGRPVLCLSLSEEGPKNTMNDARGSAADNSGLGQPALRDPLDGSHVSYLFSCRDVQGAFAVTGFTAVEELNRPYSLTIELSAEDEATDGTELLGQDITFRLERGDAYERVFCGLVDQVRVVDTGQVLQSCSLVVVPALFALNRTQDTRIFQDKTALDILLAVLTEGLSPYGREIDVSAVNDSRLLNRDYCVQYRESTLDFVHRLLEEEGIGYHFVHEESEKLILFDDNLHFQRTSTIDGGALRYDPTTRGRAGAEPIVRFEGSARRTSTSVTTRDHDWTRATTQQVQATASVEGSESGRRHDVYEHGLERHLTMHEHKELAAAMLATLYTAALPRGLPPGLGHRLHTLDGANFDAFTSNNADDRALVRAQWLGRDARTFVGRSLVRSLSPGGSFEITGHPSLGADGDYFITKVVHGSSLAHAGGSSTEGGDANYANRFECLPLSTPWRPDRVTEKPRIHSIQTARVTGPVGLDIHTDPYGRIRVRFPWDRTGESLAGDNSCWTHADAWLDRMRDHGYLVGRRWDSFRAGT